MNYVFSSCSFHSPLGWVTLRSNGNAIESVSLQSSGRRRAPGNALLKKAQKEMEDYFSGRRKSFSVQTFPQGTPFQKRVWKELLTVPYGCTLTYKDLATLIRSSRASRAVGNALGKNPIPILIPCHRIIAAGRKLGGFTGGISKKRWLLQHEGVGIGSY